MHVTKIFDEWSEDYLRKREWMSIKDTFDNLKKSDLKMLLEKFEKNIKEIKSLIADYS